MPEPLVYGHIDTGEAQCPAGSPSPIPDDMTQTFVGLLWSFALSHGVIPLKADDVAEAIATDRVVYEHSMTAPDGDPAYLAFDVTDAEPGALEAVTDVLRKVGL